MEQKINITDIKIKMADYPKSRFWEDTIYEKGGFDKPCCFVCDYEGKDLEIYFNLIVGGKYHQIKGDYLTPGTSFTDIEYTDIIINDVIVDDVKVSVGNITELVKFLQENID